jgi:hypothetical protein
VAARFRERASKATSLAGEALSALLGLSAYSVTPPRGPTIDDPMVERVREAMGGQLVPMPTSQTRWYLADLEAAQVEADTGNLELAARLCRAMRRDGTFTGLMRTLTSGVVSLPRKFYGDPEQVEELDARNGSRSVYDDMFPPSELSLLAHDGHMLVGVAELVPVEGRDFPIMIRLEPEFLRYRWNENRWYYSSVAGLLPITPGDGRWVLHVAGGRVDPWLSGIWYASGRSYINKEHAMLSRSNYIAKLANPARAAVAPNGATEQQRVGMLSRLIAWGLNTVFELPPGWDVKLIETKGEGFKVFQDAIDTSDKELAVTIAGQVVTVDGGTGFQNSDLYRMIRGDIIQDVARSLSYTLNTQGLPPWIVQRYGLDALRTGAIVDYDVKRPKDLEAEARSMTGLAQSIAQLQQAIAGVGRGQVLDVNALLVRFGVPIEGDVNGDGAVDSDDEIEARAVLAARLSDMKRWGRVQRISSIGPAGRSDATDRDTENARDRSVYRLPRAA